MTEDEQLKDDKEQARKHFLNLATSDDQRNDINAAFDKPLREFTKFCRSILNVSGAHNEGCPLGWTTCDDGSCAPPGALC